MKTRKRKIHSKNVFVVHGHDLKARNELVAILQNEFNLKPIVLMDEPSRGKTLIEKFEKNTLKVSYAIVILTPDDMGYSKKKREKPKSRARENVILEMGYFVGKLKRRGVCCIVKRDRTIIPSDLHGLVPILFMKSVNEIRNALEKELKAAGFRIRKKSESIVAEYETRDPVPTNLDPKLEHVSAVLYYPPSFSWKRGERNPRKKIPRYKMIINHSTKKAYYMTNYAYNFVVQEKIQWITKVWKGEKDFEMYPRKIGVKLIHKPASKKDLYTIRK